MPGKRATAWFAVVAVALAAAAAARLLWPGCLPAGRSHQRPPASAAAPSGQDEAPAFLEPGRTEVIRSTTPRDSPDWSLLVQAVADPKRRSRALEESLTRPDLIPWLLERLESAEFAEQDARPIGLLLRGVLSHWERLPAPAELEREPFMDRVIRAGAATDRSASAVAFAWRKQRFLSTRHRPWVNAARPAALDGLTAQQPGAARADLFLAVLEDVLRAHLESDLHEVVAGHLQDPSMRVRILAYRLYFGAEGASDWYSALASFDQVTAEERAQLAEAIAREVPPADAAELLLMLEARFGSEEEFLGAWHKLAARSPASVGGVYQALLGDPGARSAGDGQWADAGEHPGLRLGAMDREADLRRDLLLAYMVGTLANGVDGTQVFAEAAEWDWNPSVRSAAWEHMARLGGSKQQAIALELLSRPGYLDSMRLPGVPDDTLFLPTMQHLAQTVPYTELWRLRHALEGMELSADNRQQLEAILAGRVPE
ncbi:MAG: hypothetical protein EYC70_10750 [Planctomycetota bacterium]|nr:MAG: hypothetical protein EYC70_10750 [Planctomycetota bacterium]